MPSVSKKQHNLMAMVAHDPKAAKRVGIPQKVGKHFVKADKTKHFVEGKQVKLPPTDTPANRNELLNRSAAPPKPVKRTEQDEVASSNANELLNRPDKPPPEPQIYQRPKQNPQTFKKGGKVKESKAMAQAEMKALKRGHASKEVMEHERKEHKEMGYKKGGHVKHAPKHHTKHMKRGGASARMKKPRIPPAALAAMLAGAGGAGAAPDMGAGAGAGAPPPAAPPMGGGMAHGGHVHHHHAKVSHHQHHHHYAYGGHVKHHAKGGLSAPTKKGPEAIIGGKSHKGHHGDEAAKKGHTKGKVVKMARGGHVGSHKHRRADGAAVKGHTSCKMR